ncbi:hypothetical protein glysoja_003406 [Glycine soja]|nr:hypothetical protein glysoja_003406 [Glycine soja]
MGNWRKGVWNWELKWRIRWFEWENDLVVCLEGLQINNNFCMDNNFCNSPTTRQIK